MPDLSRNTSHLSESLRRDDVVLVPVSGPHNTLQEVNRQHQGGLFIILS